MEQTVYYEMNASPDSKIHGANMGPLGSCRPQMGPMLAPWTLLSGSLHAGNKGSWKNMGKRIT